MFSRYWPLTFDPFLQEVGTFAPLYLMPYKPYLYFERQYIILYVDTKRLRICDFFVQNNRRKHYYFLKKIPFLISAFCWNKDFIMFKEIFANFHLWKSCLGSCFRKMKKIEIRENTIFEIFENYGHSGPPCWIILLSLYMKMIKNWQHTCYNLNMKSFLDGFCNLN